MSRKIFEATVSRNYAISTFNAMDIEHYSSEHEELGRQFEEEFGRFEKYMDAILEDFRQKQCLEIHLLAVRDRVKQRLGEVVQHHELYLRNRYAMCESDEFKDLIIGKQNYYVDYGHDQASGSDGSDSEEEKVRKAAEEDWAGKEEDYEYVSPERDPEPPKELEYIKFMGVDLAKQCYIYDLRLPSEAKHNKLEGIIIKSFEEPFVPAQFKE